MTYTLEQLSHLEDIRMLKHRYFRAIDTADISLLGALFTADLTVDYRGGHYRVQLEGRENMLEFLANSFHSGAVAMHQGHMPEISLIDDLSAQGNWYLEDIFINLEHKTHTSGSAIYHDRYRREDGSWKIAHTEYERIYEMIRPLRADEKISCHYLATVGRKPEDRTDINHLIRWQ